MIHPTLISLHFGRERMRIQREPDQQGQWNQSPATGKLPTKDYQGALARSTIGRFLAGTGPHVSSERITVMIVSKTEE